MSRPPVLDEAACRRLLTAEESNDILYFYAHGHTARPYGPADARRLFLDVYDGLPEGSVVRREFEAAYRRMREPGSDEQSWIALTYGRLMLNQLYAEVGLLAGTPIVILNTCESAQVTPSLAYSFVHFFLTHGASAVLGTECPMTIHFAHPFGEALLAGDPVEPSLRPFASSAPFDYHFPVQKLVMTWLGHSTFILRTPGGKRVLFDPWLSNPNCPESMKKPPKVDLILVSHGHFDHMDDVVGVARDTGAPVVGIFELCDWLGRKGIQNVSPMNKGGSQEILGLRVTMTDARHSSGYVDDGQMVYMGEPAGFVVRLEDGMTIYYAGDTCLFGDMRLIGELYKPDIAFLPIGDRFTMDPVAGSACL